MIALFCGCSHLQHANQGGPKAFTIRLQPGEDVKAMLSNFAKTNHLKATSIVSAVGSLTRFSLRYANQKNPTVKEGHFEIVSLSGTLSEDSMHIHASVSDEKGRTYGGHLTEGNLIYTTLEVTVLEQVDKVFSREQDAKTGYQELIIKNR